MTDWNSELQPDPNQAQPGPAGPGPVTIAVNIFTSPSEAFTALEKRPTVLFPLLISILSTVLLYGWYFQVVDYEWFIDDTISQMSATMPEEQREAVTEAMRGQSQTMMLVSGTVGGALGILLMYALQAGYLTMVSALSGDSYRFRHWFSLINWTALPYLLVILVMAVNLLLSPNGQINLNDANSLSLTNLGFPESESGMAQIFLTSINLPMLWSLALTYVGYQQWLKCSHLKAAVVVLAPYAAIFGILAYFAFT